MRWTRRRAVLRRYRSCWTTDFVARRLVNSGATSTDITQQMVDAVTRFEAMQSSFQTAMRVQYTLDGFDSLARYLMGIPGRKKRDLVLRLVPAGH